MRNFNDGLSAVNIAEGAMNELGNIIVRVEELATQSISETYSDTQRQALQKEATALTAEWNRIVESTSFNGQNLLTGSNTRTVLQGGKGNDGTLAVQVGAAQQANGIEGSGGTGTTRISTSSTGGEGNSISYANGISADGRYVAFHSVANNLVTGDSNGVADAFVKDTLTGTTTRVSTDSSGGQATGGDSETRAMSDDGRYVAFWSDATNLVAGDTNGQRDAFIKDTLTGRTTRVSTDSAGNQATGGDSTVTAISSDGRYVAFYSAATNLVEGDTNSQIDSFVKDTLTGITRRVSTDSAGNQSIGGLSYAISLSADGRYVTMWSQATNLVANDTNGLTDAFVKDTVTGTTTRVSTSSSGTQGNGGSYTVVISADGRYVGFQSDSSNLVADDTNGARDAFIKDLVTGVTTRVNTDKAGNQATGGFSYFTSISADGRFVAFNSRATNLVAGDTNGMQDTFVKDVLTGDVVRTSIDSAGNQATGQDSFGSVLSADGRFALLNTFATNLVSGDTNAQRDAFLRDLTRTGVQQLAGVVVSNKASAKVTLDLAQRYRAELLDYRSKLGATTSRITTFVNTLQSSTINYKAASSRITDADVAEEAAKSIASGIRQQVASSLLGQANQAPQIGLQLLRNA